MIGIGGANAIVEIIVRSPHRRGVRSADRLIEQIVARDVRIAVVMTGDLPPHPSGIALVVGVRPVLVLARASGVVRFALATDDTVHINDGIDASLGGVAYHPIEFVESVRTPS